MPQNLTVLLVLVFIGACSSGAPVNESPDQNVVVEPDSGAIVETVDESADEATAVAQNTSSSGDKVCRYEKQIGSRIGKRVCRTVSGEAARREAGQAALEENQSISDRERYNKEF